MTSLADVHRALQTTIAAQRLGRPVFVRYHVEAPDPAEAVVPRLVRLATAVRHWLGQTPDRVYAVGAPDHSQVALTLQFKEGGSGLVSFARGHDVGVGVELMVLGNHGAAYHERADARFRDEDAGFPSAPPDAALRDAIERSLRTGAPVPVGQRAMP